MEGPKRRIALLSYRDPDESPNSYFALLRRGVTAGAHHRGLEVGETCQSGSCFDSTVTEDCAGMVVLGSFHPEELARQFSGPTVFVNHSQPPFIHDSVHIHFEQAVEVVVEHLLALGHRRIAVIGGVEYLESLDGSSLRHYRGEPRREFFVRAVKRHGLWSPYYVVDGDWSLRGGFEAMRGLLNLADPPTAVFAANDRMAVGALRAVREAGLAVPRDVSLVGFDDLPSSADESPPLTTVRVPIDQLGRTAADLLADRLEGRTTALHVQAMTELVIRGTTAAPPRR